MNGAWAEDDEDAVIESGDDAGSLEASTCGDGERPGRRGDLVLEQSGLVLSEKVGRVRTYQIEPKGFAPIADWVAERRTLMERRLDRLGELLAATEPSTQEPSVQSKGRVK